MLVDLTWEQLQDFRPDPPAAPGFDDFWSQTLADPAHGELEVRMTPWEGPLRAVDVQDVTYRGYGGADIKGWYMRPAGAGDEPLPCVVMFEGYGGGRGLPHEWLFWPTAGYATFVMDTRGQGSGHRRGDTPDPGASGTPHYPGFLSDGIEARETYYYRRVFTDAVRAVAAARSLPGVDPTRTAAGGASQGGAIALAVSGLVPDLRASLVDVPFLCHIRRALDVTEAYPYQELVRWARVHKDDRAMWETLAYFDGMNFAERGRAAALFSTGLRDPICPPSTVVAAYHRYAGPCDLAVFPYAGHEGGFPDHLLRQAEWLAVHL